MPLANNYEYVIDKSHPRANAVGMVYVHVLVAEKKLKRHLKPEETVHHRDFNKHNNNPDNLMVFATKADHTAFHKNNCDESLLVYLEDGTFRCLTKEYTCTICGTEISSGAKMCVKCTNESFRKVPRPSSNELHETLCNNKGNFTCVGKLYGVSDNAVRKWCKQYNMSSKSKSYRQIPM